MSKDLTQALHDLMQQNTANVVQSPKPRGEAGAATSVALPPGRSSNGSSSGIASPLTEGAIGTREYYAGGWKSSDGLFTFPAIKSVTFTDANGVMVKEIFANPTP